MISDKQLAANRENAKKSTGPSSQVGKDRSRLNSFRHGCSKQTRILPEHEMEAYVAFTNPLATSLQPASELELNLAQQYADFQWRINRCAAIEDNMFTLGFIEEVAENLNIEHPEAHIAASNAKTFRQEAREFDRLSLYSQRLINGAAKVLKQLHQIQAERRQREQSEMSDAVLIYKNYRAAGGVFDPQKDGFVLTLARIESYMRRDALKSPGFVAAEVKQASSRVA